MGRKVNRRELAEIFGVSPPTVSAWIGQGCPVDQRGRKGKEWILDTEAVADWRLDQHLAARTGSQDLDHDEARRRREAAQAQLAEIDLAKRRGEVVEIEAVYQAVSEDYARCRARLLSIPVRLAPQVQYLEDLKAIRVRTEALLREALEELTSYDGGEAGEGGDLDPDGEDGSDP